MKTRLATFILSLFALMAWPSLAWAQSSDFCSGTTLCNPTGVNSILPSSGTTVADFFTQNILGQIILLIVPALVLMVVYSAFRMITSNGNTEQVSKAKTALQWTVLGTSVVILAYVIIFAVNDFLGGVNIDSNGSTGVQNPIGTTQTPAQLFDKIFNGIAGLVAIISVLFIIINGFRYLTAQGNDEQVQAAKTGL